MLKFFLVLVTLASALRVNLKPRLEKSDSEVRLFCKERLNSQDSEEHVKFHTDSNMLMIEALRVLFTNMHRIFPEFATIRHVRNLDLDKVIREAKPKDPAPASSTLIDNKVEYKVMIPPYQIKVVDLGSGSYGVAFRVQAICKSGRIVKNGRDISRIDRVVKMGTLSFFY